MSVHTGYVIHLSSILRVYTKHIFPATCSQSLVFLPFVRFSSVYDFAAFFCFVVFIFCSFLELDHWLPVVMALQTLGWLVDFPWPWLSMHELWQESSFSFLFALFGHSELCSSAMQAGYTILALTICGTELRGIVSLNSNRSISIWICLQTTLSIWVRDNRVMS